MSEYIGVRLDPELKQKVKVFCAATNTDISEFIRAAINGSLVAHGEKPDELRAAMDEMRKKLKLSPRTEVVYYGRR